MAIQKLFTSLSKSAQSATHVGEVGRIWYDATTGFRIGDGVTPGGQAAAVAVTNANIGDLVITGATISTLNTNEDLNLVSNGTGNVNVKGAFVTATTGGRTIIETLQNGTLNFYVPTIGYDSAIDIIGSADGSIVAPQNTGVLLHLTGQDSLPARIYNDSANNYAAFIGRRYNGTASAPTQVLAGNIIARVGATPYGSTGWPSISTARLDFVALENQTASNQGTSIQFYTTPLGSASSVPSMTVASTGISNAANVVPVSDETYFLGSPALRWQGVYVGKGGLTMADSTTNVNVPISVNNGTLYLNSVQNIVVGNLVITDTTLTTATSATNINVGATDDTGFFYVKRKAQFDNTSFGPTEAMVSFNASGGDDPDTIFPDTVLQSVGRPNKNSRFIQRSYGSTGTVGGDNSYSVWGSYVARGNVSNPSAIIANDILSRISSNGYGTTTWGSGGTRIESVAEENFTDSAKGSRINFWTTPTGSIVSQLVASVNSIGLVANGIQFSTDSTIQTTAGIPLTQKGVAQGVATLGVDGRLTTDQIPSSLTGAITFQGGWNAYTNTPTLANGTGTTGYQYIVTTPGNRDLGAGNVAYASGDTITYGGGVWNRVQGTSPISSVSGNLHVVVGPTTGAVVIGVDATPNAGAGTIVSRDASGNFAANTITAALSGQATSAITAATVTAGAQTAITSVGTLTSLAVTGNITAGNVTTTTGTITAATGQFTNINNSLQTITANIGAFETFSNANTAGLYNSILGANTAIQTLSANVGAFEIYSNANVGAIYNTVTTHTTWLGNLQANVYTNANVVAYLNTATINTTGNITAGNATIINTLTANTVITGLGGIRTISGGTPTITLNFNTDKIIQVYQPAGTVTLQYGTLVAGASVTVLINLTTARNIVSGVSASNNINLGGKTNIGGIGNAPAATAQSLVKLVYTSVDGTAGNTYCAVNYS